MDMDVESSASNVATATATAVTSAVSRFEKYLATARTTLLSRDFPKFDPGQQDNILDDLRKIVKGRKFLQIKNWYLVGSRVNGYADCNASLDIFIDNGNFLLNFVFVSYFNNLKHISKAKVSIAEIRIKTHRVIFWKIWRRFWMMIAIIAYGRLPTLDVHVLIILIALK